MSLWWASKDQLDDHQLSLIEDLQIEGSYLVLGPPGSGKTNVLLRRAQFIRSQSLPNILVLTFTRPLTEFLRTGCFNANGDEIFPPGLITTYESWIREIYYKNKVELPPESANNLAVRKAQLAKGAIEILKSAPMPRYDALFVDEAQDLLPEEVELIRSLSDRLFFVGDDRQRIYGSKNGLESVRALAPPPVEKKLSFHYRLAPEICSMADRILKNVVGGDLASSSHYKGPKPARIDIHALQDRAAIIDIAVRNLIAQARVYSGLLQQGDRLGIVVPKRVDRDLIFRALEGHQDLNGRSQIVRARTGDASDNHSTALDPGRPILIMTEQGCKGLEFRAVHWLFVDDNTQYRTNELYYTVVTRAKTSLDIYHSSSLPPTLSRAYAKPGKDIWS
ncbi:AAA family ATPase [Sinorhizobium numidicum]|uniref:DNA 3'-5' helicase II n=1 Tax=Sinorhizobium numidicum TaxID=680248 RepID=A0ABY8D2N0_9HYPH|nr:UvrD-helicase domain-containing protein [Sinorhizobium numidicum]WEX77948.1 AAA family ATPase [Sinorhizobium numidicum]WEX84607.1 AAA family ATPase [Sinorhizobium numidicum]